MKNNSLILFWYILFLNVISGCSSNENNAPVHNIAQVIPLHERVKQPINHTKYKVKSGETLYTIAWRANSDVRTVAKLNNIKSPYRIFPGQILNLSERKLQASKSKGSVSKSNNRSTKTKNTSQNGNTKKKVASTKKQAYGENVENKKRYSKGSKTQSEFSQKISKWQWPAKGKVISKFSSTAQGNKGIDIAGRRSDNIKAAANGKVVYVGEALRGYGKLVIIKHNEDYLSAYAHNDRILVKEKQQVNVGDVIAKMGDSGTQRVMLHFEVRFRGKSVNPLKYLPK
ncbi:MAG: peptidoglycan DD-metalloendopeptidase family protein [Colwellia sp.]